MPGASPLFDVYGYWPTLHDATVTSYSVGYENKEIAVMVDYDDLKEGAENRESILTRTVLLWRRVSEAKLFFYSSDISYIDFVAEGGLIRTVFEQHPNGIDGHILSCFYLRVQRRLKGANR